MGPVNNTCIYLLVDQKQGIWWHRGKGTFALLLPAEPAHSPESSRPALGCSGRCVCSPKLPLGRTGMCVRPTGPEGCSVSVQAITRVVGGCLPCRRSTPPELGPLRSAGPALSIPMAVVCV